ncbi:MAG: signal peptidase II [Armatimonadota bacterium]|nr:signal peptidase II [Armatimonadota bacterium]
MTAEVELLETPTGPVADVKPSPAVEGETLASALPQDDAVLRRHLRTFALWAILTLIVDQLSKVWIRAALSLGDEVPVLPGWVHLSHVLNRGAAWGMLSGQRLFLIGVTVVVIWVVSVWAREVVRRGAMARIGLGLILGGAVGNLIDRLRFGAVTDFIDLDTPVEWLRTFPVFNVADSALTVGVTLLLIGMIFHRRI